MAITTVPFAVGTDQPRIPNGVEAIEVEQTYNRSVSASDGDRFDFTLLKVPSGATIYKLNVLSDTSDGATIYKVGIAGGITSAALFGSVTVSGTAQLDALLPAAGTSSYKVSVSDDAHSRFVYLTLTQDGAVGSSPTGSVSVCIQIGYHMNRAVQS